MIYIATILKKIVPVALIAVGYGQLCAQDADNAEIPSIETMIEANMLIVPGIEPQSRTLTLNSDAAYIYQIGTDNIARVQTQGENNELKLMQRGDANKANINISGKTLVHNTLQNGNGNVFLEYTNAGHLNLERQILQDGSNQNLVIYGSNSLTESIQLNLKGDSQALTIRSFN